MRKLVFIALAAVLGLTISCNRKVAGPEIATIEGVICDLTPENLLLSTDAGDTIVVSTPNVDSLPGVFINDKVSISCQLNQTAEGTDFIAESIQFIKADYQHLIDSWTTPIVGLTGGQGFILFDDNTARSVNLPNMDIVKWGINDSDNLVLVINKKKGAPDIQSPAEYIIEKLTADSLVLVNAVTLSKDWILTNQQ